jgi:hypothetical protein
MAITQNTYTGNGSTVLYSFTFPYLETTDVKVTVNGVITTAYTFANATTIQFNTAPVAGAAIRIYRDTDDASLAATFYSGSAIRAQDLNDNFTQNLYVTQEVNNNSVNIDGSNPMVGPLNMNGFQITNLPVPAVDTNAATKKYVDDRFGNLDIPGHTRWRKVATASQTTFSGTGDYGGVLAYSPTREQVYINGALQQRGVDYAADNGTSVVFTVGLTVGDVVDIICVNNLTNSSVSNAGNITYSGQFTGQSARTVAAKLADVVSVKDFGAVGDGVTDDTAAFEAAAAATRAEKIFTQTDDAERPPTARVYVPAGEYLLTHEVNNSGKYIYWELDSGAVIPSLDTFNQQYNGSDPTWSTINPLWGSIVRPGQRSNLRPMGTRDLACANTAMVSANPQRGSEINGFSVPRSVGTYPEFGAAGFYADVYADPNEQIRVANVVSYSATAVTLSTPLTAAQRNRCLEGTVVSTYHEPKKYSATISSVSADGLTINVQIGWYLAETSTTATPPGTDGLVINPITKIWGANFQCKLPVGTNASAASGIEIGLTDWDSESDKYSRQYNLSETSNPKHVWGIHCTNFFTNKIQKHFYADGASWFGLHVEDADTGYWYSKGGGSSTAILIERPTSADSSRCIVSGNGSISIDLRTSIDTGTPTIDNEINGTTSFWDSGIDFSIISSVPTISIGRTFAHSDPTLVFNALGDGTSNKAPAYIKANEITSGNDVGTYFDVVATGTDSRVNLKAASGRVYLSAPDVLVENATRLRPANDNLMKLGDSSNRWSTVYAGTGTINTSDGREKQDIELLSDTELRVATALKGLIKKFRFTDAVQLKGDDARIHVGVVTQEVIAAFQAEGLDPMRYGIVCYDQWDATDAEPAGDRYGIRYEELLAFIIAAL